MDPGISPGIAPGHGVGTIGGHCERRVGGRTVSPMDADLPDGVQPARFVVQPVPPKRRILAVGGAHIDRRGRLGGPYVPGASNPGRLSEDVGGGVFNALRNAVQAGVGAAIVSLRGGDAAGETVARAIAEAGIDDLSAVFLDRATPSYTALIDAQGELIAGLADMELYDIAFAKQLRRSNVRQAAQAADALLIDANLPEPAITVAMRLGATKPLYAIAVSPAKVARLSVGLPGLAALFMTAREAASLSGIEGAAPLESARALRRRGLRRAVITAGGGRLTGFDTDGLFTVDPPQARSVADVTGAGDALAGIAIAALVAGLPFRAALRRGMAAALLTIELRAAVAVVAAPLLEEAVALVPDPQPAA